MDRAVVVTGGWQTSQEGAYVQASRAREGTDWHVAREDLGTEGVDAERVGRLAEMMRASRAQLPSLAFRAVTPARTRIWARSLSAPPRASSRPTPPSAGHGDGAVSRVAITLDEHALAELQPPGAGRRGAGSKDSGAVRPRRAARTQAQAQAASEQPASATTPKPAKGKGAGSPGWLQPPGEQERWRRELWAAVSALAERYPRVFSKLVADWWTDRALIEVLGALSAWRSQLDTGREPRPARGAAVPRSPGAARAPAHPGGRSRPPRASPAARRRQSGLHSRSRPGAAERLPVTVGQARRAGEQVDADRLSALG